MSSPVRLDAAGPELTPRTLPVQLDRIRQGTLNTVLATVASLEGPRTVAEGDLAVVPHFQGSAPLGGQVEMVDAEHIGLGFDFADEDEDDHFGYDGAAAARFQRGGGRRHHGRELPARVRGNVGPRNLVYKLRDFIPIRAVEPIPCCGDC